MKLFEENQILDPEYRKQVIAEILGAENVQRKREMRKRYEVYKDQAMKYVAEKLSNEGLEAETVVQMVNRASNISLCRKVVDKLARAYIGGVNRITKDEISDAQVQEMGDLMNFDQKQKKSDKYRELYKNCAIQFVPELDQVESSQAGSPRYNIKQRVYSPWQYDVIEDSHDRERARVYILSDYSEIARPSMMAEDDRNNRTDDKIADAPEESGLGGPEEFIWWSDDYHFTTNENGEIMPNKSPEDLANPISLLNFVRVSEDQDNHFWAEGGDDLIHGSILVNTIITDMFAIAYQQGWGQFVITGKNVQQQQKVGPHNAMVFEVEDSDDPRPSVEVVSANPPLDSWMKSVEQYVALLLSTNNLSPATVSVKLDAVQFPSGIAMLIEMSEAVNEVIDTQEMFVDAERKEWEIVKRWQNLYFDKKALTGRFAAIGKFPEDLVVSTVFKERQPVVTENEKLNNIKIRKDLGINTMLELIMIDEPQLKLEQAEEKLKKILEEKIEAMGRFSINAEPDNEGDDDDDQGE